MNWIRFWQNYRYSTALCSLFSKFVLQSLSRYSASQKISQASSSSHSLTDLLSVSLRHLDGEAEMRKFFGSKVVQATKAGESSNRKKVPAVRSNLTRPQPTWWAAKGREGLSLRQLSDDEVDAKLKRHAWNSIQEKWWTVEYSKKYKSMTKAFMETVLSGGVAVRYHASDEIISSTFF